VPDCEAATLAERRGQCVGRPSARAHDAVPASRADHRSPSSQTSPLDKARKSRKPKPTSICFASRTVHSVRAGGGVRGERRGMAGMPRTRAG
jgi:hypothetical protein